MGPDRAVGERLLVTVVSPSGEHSLDVPLRVRVADLLPPIVEACERGSDATGWKLKPRGEEVLAAEQTLGELGLFPGAILELIVPHSDSPIVPASLGRTSLSDRFPLPSGKVLSDLVRGALRRTESAPRIESMSEADYMRFLDSAVAARDISNSLVVAVMSSHPVTGRTTIAALLATLLGRMRPDAVTVVDANPETSALSHWLAPHALRPDFDPELTPQNVLSALVNIGNATSVLPAAIGKVDWERLIEHLRRLQKIVIIDCAAGFRKPACRAVLAAADLIVLVSASRHHDLEIPAGKTVIVVANQAARRARSAPRSDGVQVVTVADEPAAAGRLKTRGFSWNEAPASWQESIRELAAVLVGSA